MVTLLDRTLRLASAGALTWFGRKHLTPHCVGALVVALATLVHWPAAPTHAQSPSPPHPTAFEVDRLPANVRATRQALLDAARSGRIEELIATLEPQQRGVAFQGENGSKAIAAWKATSPDGEGISVLADLANLLMMDAAGVHLGPDKENNRLFIWPYLAERPLDRLSPAERVDLLRLVVPSEAAAMVKTNKWTHWRLVISADGIWQMFKKDK
jgi:hypothetical protein